MSDCDNKTAAIPSQASLCLDEIKTRIGMVFSPLSGRMAFDLKTKKGPVAATGLKPAP
jgi:hypothetical protein